VGFTPGIIESLKRDILAGGMLIVSIFLAVKREPMILWIKIGRL